MEFEERTFNYVGEPMLTRGDLGVNVTGGHNTPEDPEGLYVFDPDHGDFCFGSIQSALESGDWKEIE